MKKSIDTAVSSAKTAGKLLRQGFGTTFEISRKEHRHDLVTEYDHAAQESIIQSIKKQHPDHHFLAEEGLGALPPEQGTCWIIDPLDGTVNFAHSIPLFSISIAVAVDREVRAGVVYLPMSDDLFIAEKGNGATLNGKPLSVSKTNEFEEALLATGFPYNVHENPLNCIERFASMVRLGHPIRRLGSAAIDLAYVAAGRFDAFWEVGLHAWDMAAGKLLVEEAGGKVSQYDGSPHPTYGYHPLLATNGFIHGDMARLLKEDLQ